MTPLLVAVLPLLTAVPEAKDVKAGWLAFGIFLLLAVATVFLCFNFVKQLRKTQAAKDAGVFGDEPADGTRDSSADDAAGQPQDVTREDR